MKKLLITVVLVVIVSVLFTSCAPVNEHVVKEVVSNVPGFWSGLWHGLILPVDLVISFFNNSVGIYATNNSGHWYDFGFVLGVMLDIFGLNGIFGPKEND